MPYEFVPHTADLRVRVWADTAEALFADAAMALMDAMVEPGSARPADPVAITCSAPALDLLLHALLSDVLFEFDARGRVIADVSVALRHGDEGVAAEAVARGERLDPARHQVKVLVKGITYHGLSVTETGGGWEATVVFDV